MTSPAPPPPPSPQQPPPPPSSPRPSGGRGPLAVAAIIAALVVVVAVASAGTPIWAPLREGQADRARLASTVAVLAAICLVVGLVGTIVVHRLVLSKRADAPRLRETLLRAAPAAILLTALASLLTVVTTDLDPVEDQELTSPDEQTRDLGSDNPRGADGAGGDGGPGQVSPSWGDAPASGSATIGDFNGDGAPQLGLDTNGDGTVDQTVALDGSDGLVDVDGDGGVADLSRLSSGEIGLDTNGDGSIDQRVPLDLSNLDLGSAQVGDFSGDGEMEVGLDVTGDGNFDVTVPLGAERQKYGDHGTVTLIVGPDGGYAAVDVDGDGHYDRLVPLDYDAATFDADAFSELDWRDLSGADLGRLFDAVTADRGDRPVAPPGVPGDALPGGDRADRVETSGRAGSDAHDGGGGPDFGQIGGLLPYLLAAVAIAVIGALAWRWWQSRDGDTWRDDDADGADEDLDDEQAAARDAMAATVGDSIGAMIDDPDPRTAIIGAYARLLEGLAHCNVGRLPHEAPLEHLRRALATLRVRPEPLRELTDLFSLARFSTHPLTEDHRAAALDALRSAAADLAANEPPPAPPSAPVGAAPTGR